MLRINNLEATYNDVILALSGISFEVSKGQIVALLGSNGAGKTTTLNLVSQLTKSQDLKIEKGDIEFQGESIKHCSADQIVRKGIVQTPEGRRIFQNLTVRENLIAGSYARGKTEQVGDDVKKIANYFPVLKNRMNRLAGYLSGGEQQMLAIGRSLMSHPKLLMMDEPSLGLAPLMVEEIFNIIVRINKEENTTILLVEQNANIALKVSKYAYILENGKIVLDGSAENLLESDDVKEFYLGLTEMGTRKNYREVKHYKRRKRWLS
jgi:branched-chain amino acid transport system ATP-binding protein